MAFLSGALFTPAADADPLHAAEARTSVGKAVPPAGAGRTISGDFDGDGKTDIAVWRPTNGIWFVIPSSNPGSPIIQQWGAAGDVPVPGDYDGDGKTDFAVWRPSNGMWFIIPSSNPGSPIIQQWGTVGDVPVPGDYDGDGKTDIAVFRPSNGTWFIIPSSNPGSPMIQQWGAVGDIPVPADYDGDGKTDFAVWRPSNGYWFIIPSGNPKSPILRQWGTSGDIPVPGDYDGDGKTDFAVWRPSNGYWFIIPSSNPGTFTLTQWGTAGDIPVPADYDGDGKTDTAVWRPSNGDWYVISSKAPSTFTIVQWGTTGDVSAEEPSGDMTLTFPAVSMSSSSMNVFVGQPIMLTWSSANAATCAASGAWSGTQGTSGNQIVTPAVAGALTYTLTCSGDSGSTYASVTVIASTPSLMLTGTFSPNTTTISTSEGAPYGDCNFWVQTAANCTNETNFGYGPTKVMRLYICLSGEVSLGNCSQQPAVTGPLSSTMLNDINTRIAAFAGTGMRVMIRFIYNFGPIGPSAMDAPIAVISTHIDQLAPIVLQNKDLVFCMEAGFIGTWGEWHDSTNGNDTAAAQKTVLDKELSYFNGVFPILVRYPGDLIQYTGTTTPQPGLGLHDDYYDSDSDEGATWNPCDTGAGYCLSNYTASQLQSYAAAVSAATMFAGEFGALDSTLQTCSALDSYSYTYNAQSISLSPYPTAIGTELQNEGCALSFYNKVGTRIELQKATIIGNPTPNGQLYMAITLANTGYGRVIRPRPATLMFVSNGNVVAQIPIALANLDLRQLVPSASPVSQTFQVLVTLPGTFPSSGSVSAALLIPDPAASLTSQPAYALPLNSLDQNSNPVFNPTTGYNVIATFSAN